MATNLQIDDKLITHLLFAKYLPIVLHIARERRTKKDEQHLGPYL